MHALKYKIKNIKPISNDVLNSITEAGDFSDFPLSHHRDYIGILAINFMDNSLVKINEWMDGWNGLYG